MNKSVQFLIIVLFLVIANNSRELNAQISTFKCGTMEYLEQQKKSDTSLESKMLFQEQQIQNWIKENYAYNSNEVITIPVVVHIVYNNEEQNVSDQRVFEQIEMTNRDYAGLNPHSMEAFSDLLKSNTGIQFCLAQKKPDGSPTNGIERRYTTDTSFTGNNKVKFNNSGGMDAWDPTKYLNIWVCKTQGFIGMAQFPNAGLNATFGAMVHYLAFGKTDANPSYNFGRVTTHEIGHCLYLYHIWGDDKGACTGTDYISDTPNQALPTFGCNKGILTDSCNSADPGIMYMNFMDYSNDSTTANFTPGQTARIRAMFEPPYGYLVSLANSDACSPPTFYEESNTPTITDISIFPNPADEFITIQPLEGYEIHIFNSLGIEVLNVEKGSDQSLRQIDISHIPNGLYFIKIGDKVGKFVVVH